MLKKILVLLAVIVAGFLAFAAAQPTLYRVQRSCFSKGLQGVAPAAGVVAAAGCDGRKAGVASPLDRLG